MKVKSILFNWHQAGSTLDRDGAGENYSKFEIGIKDVKEINEYPPGNGMELYHFDVTLNDGTAYKYSILTL